MLRRRVSRWRLPIVRVPTLTTSSQSFGLSTLPLQGAGCRIAFQTTIARDVQVIVMAFVHCWNVQRSSTVTMTNWPFVARPYIRENEQRALLTGCRTEVD